MGSINLSVDVSKLDGVMDALSKVDIPASKVKKILENSAQILVEEARSRAPIRTKPDGVLRSSIRVGRRPKSGINSVEVGVFYPDAPYANLVEGGHGGPKPAPPHAFLKPAADAVGDQVLDAIMEELKREMD